MTGGSDDKRGYIVLTLLWSHYREVQTEVAEGLEEKR